MEFLQAETTSRHAIDTHVRSLHLTHFLPHLLMQIRMLVANMCCDSKLRDEVQTTMRTRHSFVCICQSLQTHVRPGITALVQPPLFRSPFRLLYHSLSDRTLIERRSKLRESRTLCICKHSNHANRVINTKPGKESSAMLTSDMPGRHRKCSQMCGN